MSKIMQLVDDLKARNLFQKYGRIFVRDFVSVKMGLEVPRYYIYYKTKGIRCDNYGAVMCAGIEMLYVEKGENDSVFETVARLLPKEFPKTYHFLRKKYGSENKIANRINVGLTVISRKHDLIEKTGPAKFKIIKEARKKKIMQVAAEPIQTE